MVRIDMLGILMLYAGHHYAGHHYAGNHYAGHHYAGYHYSWYNYAEYHDTGYHYAEYDCTGYHYAWYGFTECRYVLCRALRSHIRLRQKKLCGTNTPAYFSSTSIGDEKKVFHRRRQVANGAAQSRKSSGIKQPTLDSAEIDKSLLRDKRAMFYKTSMSDKVPML
jgi:hypothetical protein